MRNRVRLLLLLSVFCAGCGLGAAGLAALVGGAVTGIGTGVSYYVANAPTATITPAAIRDGYAVTATATASPVAAPAPTAPAPKESTGGGRGARHPKRGAAPDFTRLGIVSGEAYFI